MCRGLCPQLLGSERDEAFACCCPLQCVVSSFSEMPISSVFTRHVQVWQLSPAEQTRTCQSH